MVGRKGIMGLVQLCRGLWFRGFSFARCVSTGFWSGRLIGRGVRQQGCVWSTHTHLKP